MDVPITKPSMVSYADELDFAQLLEKLLKDKHNGFMRITSGADEGYIIFKNGKQVAAEYNRFSKSEAIENIMSAVEDEDTVIEVFDLRPSHIDYIIDLNKPFLMEPDYDVSKVIDELRGTDQAEPLTPEKRSRSTNSITEPEPVKEPETTIYESISEPEPKKEADASQPESVSEADAPEAEPVPESGVESEPAPEAEPVPESEAEFEPVREPEPVSEVDVPVVEPAPEPEKISEVEKPSVQSDSNEIEPNEVKSEPMDRSKLLKKYGIKEMDEDDVEDLLDSYKGGSLNEDDVEKIELTLMNRIKKSIFGIPKIKGTEVMVFLENTVELTGDINIIIEYGAKGFFSRLMGESKDIENLRRQVINIVQIEIKKSFRKYPEIVNKFNINVEIS